MSRLKGLLIKEGSFNQGWWFMMKKTDSYKNDAMTAQSSPTIKTSGSTPATYDASPHANAKKGKTRVTVKYDVGFHNTLYIRGQGANLNWERGIQMKNVKADEWVWESDNNFSQCEFKVLINDRVYENGPNHKIQNGNSIQYTPRF